jgi:hypothetical protein
MKTLLEKAKQQLIVQANELYDIRKEDLDLDILSFENHYKNLGSLVFQIECYESLGDIVKDLENDNLQELGYWGADEDMIEDFLTEILKNK